MELRRRLIMEIPHKLDTTAKILEYGKYYGRGYNAISSNANWGITDWILFNPQNNGGPVTIEDTCTEPGVNDNQHTYKYCTEDESFKDWYYHYTDNRRTIRNQAQHEILYRIAFSIYLPRIDSTYALCVETGQIFFAGKDTPYYGYTNINDMP